MCCLSAQTGVLGRPCVIQKCATQESQSYPSLHSPNPCHLLFSKKAPRTCCNLHGKAHSPQLYQSWGSAAWPQLWMTPLSCSERAARPSVTTVPCFARGAFPVCPEGPLSQSSGSAQSPSSWPKAKRLHLLPILLAFAPVGKYLLDPDYKEKRSYF